MNKPINLNDEHHDGIVEEDNPLPRWWVYLFIGTLIFAVIYVAYYHFGPGASQQQELDAGMKKIAALQHPASAKPAANSSIDQFAISPDKVKAGKVVYDSKCAACHGGLGEGLIGPNLTDNAWINGDGSGPAVYQVIHDGVVQKGMLAWKDTLSESDLNAVTVYVLSLKGTHPANPKAPEGAAIGQ